MQRYKNGDRFGESSRLEFVDYLLKSSKGIFICDCGKFTIKQIRDVLSGNTKSCGCLKSEMRKKKNLTHGLSNHPLHRKWQNIKERCYRKANISYKNYGEKGIKVCQEWLSDFTNFYNWALQNGWKDGLTIERKDNSKDYCPENCKFATMAEQSRNCNRNIILIAWGETKTLEDWADDIRCKVTSHTIHDRIKSGLSIENAISFPRNSFYRKVQKKS